MIKILVADDHAIIRTGISVIINEFIPDAIVEEAADGLSAYSMLSENEYSLLVLDVSMSGTNSISLVERILENHRDSKILMLSMYNEELYAKRYLQIGVMGYVSKSAPKTEIKKAIENVLDNRKYISSSVLEEIAHDFYSEKFSNPFEKLSKRELEILKLVATGRGVTSISEELDLEPSTVGTYKARIFKKLNCISTVDINSLAGLYNFAL